MRSQIDQHVEKPRERIGDIAFKMKDETKIYEEIYLKSLKESFPSFDQSKSLEDELNEIEDTFRNTDLLIQSIKEMQQKKEESLSEIQLKFNQMSKIKDNLMATNHFKPNLSSCNQKEDTSLFGSINLNGYSKINSFDSEILIQDQNKTSLFGSIKLNQYTNTNSFNSQIFKR
jgi:predicted  nucleic acid-binding Zn-ribbon protein